MTGAGGDKPRPYGGKVDDRGGRGQAPPLRRQGRSQGRAGTSPAPTAARSMTAAGGDKPRPYGRAEEPGPGQKRVVGVERRAGTGPAACPRPPPLLGRAEGGRKARPCRGRHLGRGTGGGAGTRTMSGASAPSPARTRRLVSSKPGALATSQMSCCATSRSSNRPSSPVREEWRQHSGPTSTPAIGAPRVSRIRPEIVRARVSSSARAGASPSSGTVTRGETASTQSPSLPSHA